MMLAIRMGLYLIFGAMAGQGLVVYDQVAGTVTFEVEHLAIGLAGLAGYAATFITSRIAKARGGKT
jgi:hypothetical protein